MGLDLVPEGCAKPGHEAEWRRFVERAFDDEELSASEVGRFSEISIPAYERTGAPRVGFSPDADAWVLEARGAREPDEVAQVLKEFHGYHVLRLARCDGVPLYSNGGLYDGVDETSFRGAFLPDCGAVLGNDLIEQAWGHKMPEAAAAYGRALLEAAAAARPPPGAAPAKRGILARLGLSKKPTEAMPFEEQVAVVEAAGRWFVFWGERGHPIRAWF